MLLDNLSETLVHLPHLGHYERIRSCDRNLQRGIESHCITGKNVGSLNSASFPRPVLLTGNQSLHGVCRSAAIGIDGRQQPVRFDAPFTQSHVLRAHCQNKYCAFRSVVREHRNHTMLRLAHIERTTSSNRHLDEKSMLFFSGESSILHLKIRRRTITFATRPPV